MLPAPLGRVYSLVQDSIEAWMEDYAPSMGAALAYYTLFSIAPLLLIIIALAGYFFGAEAARGEIMGQLSGLIGEDGARAVEALIKSARQPAQSMVAAAIGVA